MDIQQIKRQTGVAGNYAITATVQYPDEPARAVTFHGSTYGGPIVMATEAGQTFVTDPGRFGPKLSEEWVRAFFDAA
jgi:hypothetical protein